MSDLAEFRPLVLLSPVLRRWPWLLAAGVVGGLAGLASPLVDPPRYSSYALLMSTSYQGSGGDLFTLASRLGIGGGGGGDISGVYDEVLRSARFARRLTGKSLVVDLLGHTQTFEQAFRLPPPGGDTLFHPDMIRGVLAGSRGLVWKVQANGLIRLSFQAENPVLAASLVDVVMQELQSYTFDMRSMGTTQKLQVVRRNLDSVDRTLQGIERRMVAFQQGNIAFSPALKLDFDRMQREASVLQSLTTSLRQSKASLEIERDSYLPTFQVIESPRPSPMPTYRPQRRWVPIGTFLGLLAGIAASAAFGAYRGEFRGVIARSGVPAA